MNRICRWCGKNVGESCPTCGCIILYYHRIWIVGPHRFSCLKCGLTFKRGHGGATHTICSACLRELVEGSITPRKEGHAN